MDQGVLHHHLLDPRSYPDETTSVSFRETHISRVYLTDRFAYKFKKPLDLGFLDYSTLARRRRFCHEEIRLNQRFSPDTYLDVVVLRQGRRGPHFGKTGRILDYAVQMRRLPEARMLDSLLDAGDPLLPAEIMRLAHHLGVLLAALPRCFDEETAATVRAKLTGNLRQTQAAIDLTLSAKGHELMARFIGRELRRLEGLIEERSRRGYVRDGHGDLHAANICMTDPIRVYDCIEFCRRFRVADVAADLAFLLMDLDFRNRRDLAGIFLENYQQHADDPDLATLLPLYKSYRAWVRGKVNTLLATDEEAEPAHRNRAMIDARRYFNLALGYQLPPRTLIMTSGLTGVGKSTLAKALAAATGATLLRSDAIRKELAGLPTDRPCRGHSDSGLYSREMTVRTYVAMHQRTAALLAKGRPAIVDASFIRAEERRNFLELAGTSKATPLFLNVTCDEGVALSRLDWRQTLGNDPSDGSREIYREQVQNFAAFDRDMPVMKIDSSCAVDYNVQQILCRLLAD